MKWGKMAASPFAFFRGAAPLMAKDLALLPTTGLLVQMCGDAHVENLGAYAAPDGEVVFDLNDFDESMPGPWEWDVKRLATSLILAGEDAGSPNGDCENAVRAFAESYRSAMTDFAQMKAVELAKWKVGRRTRNSAVKAIFEQAEKETPEATLKKLTVSFGKSSRRFHDKPPKLQHVSETVARAVLRSLAEYRQTLNPGCQQIFDAYRPMDVAFKVVGTGSIGTRDYVVYLVGLNPDDVLFLQVKEALPSCYSPYLKNFTRGGHQGKRVAEGQQRMQTFTDPFVGWTSLAGGEYLVRQLSDHKACVEKKGLQGNALIEYAQVCGEVLAKGHARTGDAAAISGYCGNGPKLDKGIVNFASAYAEQTRRDYGQLLNAIKSGRVKARK